MLTLKTTSFKAGETPDTLHIASGKSHVRGFLNVFGFKDKDTHHFVAYSPAFEISGYGNTREESLEMLKGALEDFFRELTLLSSKRLQEEMRKLGWKQNKLRKKEYSALSVDVNGQLKNLNAVENSIEKLCVEAA